MKTEKVLKKNAIKAYKAFNSDLTCKGFQYEVGKEYRHKGKLEVCRSGFHACFKPIDCFKYYRFSAKETRVAEVLVWGSLEYDDCAGSKVCASNIKIIRELSWQEVIDFCNAGTGNSGLGNSGCNNRGLFNSGNLNTGDLNSGNYNTGGCNTGSYNTGSYNTGYFNSGCYNYGNNNYGSFNWGNGNSGDLNTGHWNSGNLNSGIFNTSAQEYTFAFNKLAKKQALSELPRVHFLYFSLIEWIPKEHMSTIEKVHHPEYVTTGGYLKKYTYKEAFRKSFEKAKRLPDWPEQLGRLKTLPNFDAKVFEEISGIKEEELM